MYEDVTYEDILQRMLDRVPSDMDTREGSIIYDALAPAAVELQLMYIELDVILNETFADTASREYLIRRAKERGIEPTEASFATAKGEFTPTTLELEIGERFSCGSLNYAISEKVSDGVYKLVCETAGTEANGNFGSLIPCNYIQGLETANLTEVLIPGEAEESTESVRERYFETFDTKAYGGNKSDYVAKTNALGGVGATKVTPIWNGGGTVKLTILDSEYSKPTTETVAYVQEQIDPTQDGAGVGIAPIGHAVTVEGAAETTINIETSITFQEGYDWSGQKEAITKLIDEYLLSLRKIWANESYTIVRISRIESIIMGSDGVLDVQGTKINGSEGNLSLDAYAIPILGEITND